jgi:hypothetical protein
MNGRRAHLGLVAIAATLVVMLGGMILLALDAAPGTEAGATVEVVGGAHPIGFEAQEPIDTDTRRELRHQLAVARKSVDGIRTIADAEAHGYVAATLDLAYSGVHYVKPEYLDLPFSPKRPTHLIFDTLGPEGRLVGLMYFINTGDSGGDAPDGFAGPNDVWHNHTAACLDGIFMIALDDVTEGACNKMGGNLELLPPDYTTRWMVHVWVVPGMGNPWGVFAHGNPALA